MLTHHLAIDLRFVCTTPDDSDEAFDEFSDRVMDELVKLETVDTGIVDPTITASLAGRTMSILMGITATTPEDARRLFLANARCALHAAECNTADWPNYEPAEGDFPPIRKADLADA